MSTGPPEPPNQPATWDHLKQALLLALDTFSVAYLSGRPADGTVTISSQGKVLSGMTIQLAPGQTFNYAVTYTDEWHNDLSGVPTTFTVEDSTGAAVPTAATLTPDPSNSQMGTGLVTAAAGTMGLFLHAMVTGGTLDLKSDDITIADGPAFTGTITVTPVA